MTIAAFIGLGAIGGPMAKNVLKSGLSLRVFDINPDALAAVVEDGGEPVSNVGEAVRDADLIITILPATQHVLEVVAGEDGVLKHAKSGAVLMDMSTIAPSGTDQLAQLCRDVGIGFVDSPVGRLVSHAIAGESLFMVGCDDEASFQLVQPYLNAMGTTIIRCGGSGMGIRAKLVNNFQLLTIAQVTAEALVLADRLGLDVDVVKEINGDTTATNGQMQVNFPSKVLVGDTEPGFTIDLAHKDMSLALQAASDVRLGLPVGSAAQTVYGSARGTVFANQDFSALLDYAAALTNIAPIRLNH